MRVELAGYNIDARMLDEAIAAGLPRERLTPEVLSAAYARISRDPRPVDELRKAALEEVGKARRSNRKIIFEMGHHSVAEHAVFNFDVLGISRLAIESLERFRLCSYTEKSQRYITLDNDFVVPEELRSTPFEQRLLALVSAQSELYERLNKALRSGFGARHPELESKKSGRRLLDGMAKEDARYVTILATTGQLGLTANARNLEHIVRRFAASPLAEVRALGRSLYQRAESVAPSLLLFTEAVGVDKHTAQDLASFAAELSLDEDRREGRSDAVELVGYTKDGDDIVAAGLLHLATRASYGECRAAVEKMTGEAKERLFHTSMRQMEFFDAPPREFEHVSFTFELVLSSSAYAQLKRHRMTSQTVQEYDTSLGVTVPESVVEAGLSEEFARHMEAAEELHGAIAAQYPHAAPYVLTNAHRRRVLMTINLREMYHFVRLREDSHAQWDIRAIAGKMNRLAAGVMPLGTAILCGKDSFETRYEQLFGRPPSVRYPDE